MTTADAERTPVDAQSSPSDPQGWVLAHGDALYRFALLRVRNTTVAEEMVQEVFLAALKAQQEFRGTSSERTWMMGILKHKIIDHFRRTTREEPVLPDNRDPLTQHVFNKRDHWKKQPEAWTVDASQLHEQREFWETFTGCLEGLPKRTAQVFVLRMVDDEIAENICKDLAISATNLWMLLHRARLQLRECLEKKWFARA